MAHVPEIVERLGVLAATHLVRFDQGDRRLPVLVAELSVQPFRWIGADESNDGYGG